jgi:hypothetical protein
MANDKIIRSSTSTRSKDVFSVDYGSPVPKVTFPFLALLFFLIIDIIDIVLFFTGIGAVVWPIITIIIILPIQIAYFNYREKKYSENGDAKLQFNVREVNDFRNKVAKMEKLNKEAAELLKAGNKAGAAAKLVKAKKVLPKSLRWLGILTERLPVIQLLPINSIFVLLSYYDNKASVKGIEDGYKKMASAFNFRVDRKIKRPSGIKK